MKVRVLQGHSVEFGGVWHNQGETITAPDGFKFPAGAVEVISEAVKAEPEAKKNKKEEG